MDQKSGESLLGTLTPLKPVTIKPKSDKNGVHGYPIFNLPIKFTDACFLNPVIGELKVG
jgi:hypothetical protein